MVRSLHLPVDVSDENTMNSKFLTIDEDLTIHYEDSGHGTFTVLLIPGWTMSTEVFSRQLAFFSESSQYRCIAYDPRAQGRSSKTQGGHFYEQHGRDLNHLIENLDLHQVVLCGWSFGTLEMLSYIDQFGVGRVTGIVMLDGPPRVLGDNREKDWVSYRRDDADGRQEFFTMGRLRNREATNRSFVEWMLENQTEENIQWLLDITNTTPDTVAALLNSTANFLDFRHVLYDINSKIPLLYVVRKELGPVVSKWASEHTPCAHVEAFGTHLMFLERSEKFNEVLLRFLANIVDNHD